MPVGDDTRLDKLIADTEREKKRGKKKRKRDEVEEWAEETSSQIAAEMPREIESFAATPLHQSDWQDQEDYELSQRPLEGEVGEREGAPVVKQNGALPEVVEHDEDGEVVEKTKKPKTAEEKAAKKAAKKARKEEERRKKAREKEKG